VLFKGCFIRVSVRCFSSWWLFIIEGALIIGATQVRLRISCFPTRGQLRNLGGRLPTDLKKERERERERVGSLRGGDSILYLYFSSIYRNTFLVLSKRRWRRRRRKGKKRNERKRKEMVFLKWNGSAHAAREVKREGIKGVWAVAHRQSGSRREKEGFGSLMRRTVRYSHGRSTLHA